MLNKTMLFGQKVDKAVEPYILTVGSWVVGGDQYFGYSSEYGAGSLSNDVLDGKKIKEIHVGALPFNTGRPTPPDPEAEWFRIILDDDTIWLDGYMLHNGLVYPLVSSSYIFSLDITTEGEEVELLFSKEPPEDFFLDRPKVKVECVWTNTEQLSDRFSLASPINPDDIQWLHPVNWPYGYKLLGTLYYLSSGSGACTTSLTRYLKKGYYSVFGGGGFDDHAEGYDYEGGVEPYHEDSMSTTFYITGESSATVTVHAIVEK